MPADIWTADTVHGFQEISTNSLFLIFQDLRTNLLGHFNAGIRSVDTVGLLGSGVRLLLSVHSAVASQKGWIGLGFGERGGRRQASGRTLKMIHPIINCVFNKKNTLILS